MRRQPGEYWFDTINESGIFYIHWYDAKIERVRRKTTRTRDRGAAETAQAQFILERATLKKADPEEVPMSLIIDRYLKQHTPNIASGDSAKYEMRY